MGHRHFTKDQKVFTIVSHQGNASQVHNELLLRVSHHGQEDTSQQVWEGVQGRTGSCAHCWWEPKMVASLGRRLRWLECSLHKHKDLSLDPQHPHKKLGIATQIWEASTGARERPRQKDHSSLLATQSSWKERMASTRHSERPCLYEAEWQTRTPDVLFWSLCTHEREHTEPLSHSHN